MMIRGNLRAKLFTFSQTAKSSRNNSKICAALLSLLHYDIVYLRLHLSLNINSKSRSGRRDKTYPPFGGSGQTVSEGFRIGTTSTVDGGSSCLRWCRGGQFRDVSYCRQT